MSSPVPAPSDPSLPSVPLSAPPTPEPPPPLVTSSPTALPPAPPLLPEPPPLSPALPPLLEPALDSTVPPPLPPIPPPLPPSSSVRYSVSTAEEPQASKAAQPTPLAQGMWVALIATGIALVALALRVPAPNPAQKIGFTFAYIAFWPAVFIGLFSIGKRFRTPKTRAVITLVLWGLSIPSLLLENSARRRMPMRMAGYPPTESSSAPFRGGSAEPFQAAQTPPLPSMRLGRDLPSMPAGFDFSPGSDGRLVKQVEDAQEKNYHATVDAYTQACAARPTDAGLALERVKFIEHFAYAEDINIESAEKDLELALDYLKSRFPNSAGTVLHVLQREWGPGFESKADGYAPLVTRWKAAERAEFYLLRAQRTDETQPAREKRYAELSFSANPSIEAGLMLATAAQKESDASTALRYLNHPIFATALPWQKRQAMNVLFDLKENARAFTLFEEIEATAPDLINQADTALRLARAGYLEGARAIFKELPTRKWNAEEVGRARFDFELEYGSAQDAYTAFREYRALGVQADPWLRERIRLFQKDATLPWTGDDFISLLRLGLMTLLILVAPAVALVPVHYWSLLRARAGKTGAKPDAQWGLRTAWLVIASILLVEIGALWALEPDILYAWLDEVHRTGVETATSDRVLLTEQALFWAIMGTLLVALLSLGRRWKLLGRGEWGIGKTIGLAFGGWGILLASRLVYTAIFPNAVSEGLATFSPDTQHLCLVLLRTTGPLGLIFSLAMLVPVLEEFIFRGVLLEALSKHIPFWWANLAQALAFAAIHENYRIFPLFTVFGLTAGWLVRRCGGGLMPAIVMHAVNNLFASFAIMFLAARGVV